MCEPILVTLLKMRPHYSQSSSENATPPGGTSPLVSSLSSQADFSQVEECESDSDCSDVNLW